MTAQRQNTSTLRQAPRFAIQQRRPYGARVRGKIPTPRRCCGENTWPAPAPLQAECRQRWQLPRDAGTAFARRAAKCRKLPPLPPLCGRSREGQIIDERSNKKGIW